MEGEEICWKDCKICEISSDDMRATLEDVIFLEEEHGELPMCTVMWLFEGFGWIGDSMSTVMGIRAKSFVIEQNEI